MAASGKRVLAMSTLGRNGRFGNQIFQYAFIRVYAQRHGLEVHVPEWIGQYLYGHRDPGMEGLRLPMFHDQIDDETTVLDRLRTPIVNVDVCGYFVYHTSWYAPSKTFFREIFRPLDEIRRPLEIAAAKLKADGRTVVGIHARRGDFAGGVHTATPVHFYLDWLRDNWNRWRSPVLLLTSDELQRVRDDFAEFSPLTSGDLGVHLPKAGYYPDHFLLSRCDVLATSNSSFSFSASMLNETGCEFYRPSMREGALIPFDPWNADPKLREGQRDEQAAYYAAVAGEIMQAADGVRNGTPGAETELNRCRRQLADLWLGMNDDTLRVAYGTGLGDAQRLLLSPESRQVEISPAEKEYAEQLRRDLTRVGLGGLWGAQFLLASMLYWRADELSIDHDIAGLPTYLEADYIAYLRQPVQAPLPIAR